MADGGTWRPYKGRFFTIERNWRNLNCGNDLRAKEIDDRERDWLLSSHAITVPKPLRKETDGVEEDEDKERSLLSFIISKFGFITKSNNPQHRDRHCQPNTFP